MSAYGREKAWAEARLSLPHNARKIQGDGWGRYWENASRDYGGQTGVDVGLGEDIVRYLMHEQKFRYGDTVLDVGCGPGTYALLFAGAAKKVLGLDLSAGMLRRLREGAVQAGFANVYIMLARWEDYPTCGSFDLVFSSFCPGVNSPEALLKMEDCSRRSCCYVSVGDGASPQPLYQLWEKLTGDRFSNDGYDVVYPLNFLLESGRNATVRYFKTVTDVNVSSRKAADNYAAYFSMFMDLDDGKRKIIDEFVRERSDGETYHTRASRVIGAVCWDVP